ncbi:MAG TPA: Spy/CpxP family protein refolding chaperone [Methylomirabilota bacterium]|jgi:Spy/CpxP family protein refolding chaperone|nr:Spy/CpxP family protein refolding chaperone [Methylomirabilota bacterium]
MMKRHAKWPLAGVLTGLVILTAGATPSDAHLGRRGAHIERRALQEHLGLTEDQVKAIREIHARHWQSMHETMRTLRENRRALREMALNETDEATLTAKAAEVRELTGQVIEARIRTLQEVARVLTPEQREKFRELRSLRPGRRAPVAS